MWYATANIMLVEGVEAETSFGLKPIQVPPIVTVDSILRTVLRYAAAKIMLVEGSDGDLGVVEWWNTREVYEA
ncbi:Uu.00g043560.m01.CDS01 [Anthostomella pinea]|uniref:Uu.00g043560.m01.CDS01 n=1 Tax=Anthostomella pinea TaxID=933095 RepID=A0AAI8V5S7_9PEZI|nr:Uu.00g043560.m01.CDS01 [Anthostomella pinea]